MKNRIRLGLLGAGRIGRTHADAIADVAGAELAAVADPVADAVAALIDGTRAKAVGPEEIFEDPAIDGVILATPTDLHADQIERAAAAGKAIFCEKPIDLDIDRARRAVTAAEQAGVALMLGFNRRYDPSFDRVIRQTRDGRIGAVELVQITSRDPAPPPLSYIAKSGGLFRDMMIHDFDIARCLMGEEFTAVNATGSALVDAAIGAAGDVDTASATLRTASGRICTITNSRRAVYGYDQRIEVHGSDGMLAAGNPLATTVSHGAQSGFTSDPLSDFFMDRYAVAYRREIEAFCALVSGEPVVYPTGRDGIAALALADAARQSVSSGGFVSVAEP